VNARLKADLDEVRTELAARLTVQEIAEIEKRVDARPFDSVLQELLAEGRNIYTENGTLQPSVPSPRR
jgi:hypothetical protein